MESYDDFLARHRRQYESREREIAAMPDMRNRHFSEPENEPAPVGMASLTNQRPRFEYQPTEEQQRAVAQARAMIQIEAALEREAAEAAAAAEAAKAEAHKAFKQTAIGRLFRS